MFSYIQNSIQILQKSGHDNPKRTIEELLAYHLNCSPLEVYNFKFFDITKIEDDMKRLLNNEPLQYIIGSVNFYGIDLKCDQRALIPRPETEKLIEIIINSDLQYENNANIIDVGTGSGCIAITLATHLPSAKIEAIDISKDAIEITRENVKKHGLCKRINIYNKDSLFNSPTDTYDAVISNPPYITSKEWKELPPSVRGHEPRIALESGPCGTEFYSSLIPEAWRVLKSKGFLFLEIGFKQAKEVSDILIDNGFECVKLDKDLQGHHRIIHASKLK